MKFYLLLRVLKMSRWSQNALRERLWINFILSFYLIFTLFSTSEFWNKYPLTLLLIQACKLQHQQRQHMWISICAFVKNHTQHEKRERRWNIRIERKGEGTGIKDTFTPVCVLHICCEDVRSLFIILPTSVHMWTIS